MDFDRRTGARLSNYESALQSVDILFCSRIGSHVLLREFGAGAGRASRPQAECPPLLRLHAGHGGCDRPMGAAFPRAPYHAGRDGGRASAGFGEILDRGRVSAARPSGRSLHRGHQDIRDSLRANGWGHGMRAPTAIDLSAVPLPAAIETFTPATLRAAFKERFLAAWPKSAGAGRHPTGLYDQRARGEPGRHIRPRLLVSPRPRPPARQRRGALGFRDDCSRHGSRCAGRASERAAPCAPARDADQRRGDGKRRGARATLSPVL